MCRFIFYILNAICGQSNLICKPKATSHIISFRFGQSPLKDHICFIKNVEFKWLKGEGIEFNTPVRSMFFTDYNKTLNVVLDDLFGGTESLTVAYRVSFFNARGKEIFKGDFNIEKKEDNSISMYSVVSRRDLSFLNYVYHKYLSKIFQDYRNFSKVPNSKVLYQKDFVELDKARLIFYFTRHRGLKEAVDSLNECLSEINQQEDIPVKINKFFDGRREHIIELQKKYASCERLYSSCASIDCELSNLLMDVLLLIEMKSEIFVDFSAMPLLNNQNIFSAVKEVKVFDLTKTIYIKKGSEFELRLLPKGNIDLYYEKDVWIFNNNIIYVSQDFCKLCRESNWGIKAFNSSDKKKSAILELYRA